MERWRRTKLAAASALTAAAEFFTMGMEANPPQRVNGVPAPTATGLIAGTPTNTVFWYTGEAGPQTDAFETAIARIDQSISVNYGLRANEEGHSLAVCRTSPTLAAISLSPTDPDSTGARGAALSKHGCGLRFSIRRTATQSLEDIQSELAGAQASMVAAKQRHRLVERNAPATCCNPSKGITKRGSRRADPRAADETCRPRCRPRPSSTRRRSLDYL